MKFLAHQLDHWLTITRAFAACFGHPLESGLCLTPLLDLWPELLRCNDYQSGGTDAQRQRLLVADRLLTLAFEAAPSLEHAEVVNYLEAVQARGVSDIPHLISIVSVLAVRPEFQALAGATANIAKKAIEREDEVKQRAALFADLARAVSPASQQEAVVYFHRGLEQMDAVGSGDYQFVNELMQFAASLHGEELSDEDSHTLSNICELNLGEEENKFNWGLYGMAMARVSGVKGLAKLARWEDRGRVTLDYTLLPYVRALIHLEKIDPAAAVAILRTANPAELYVCGTEQLIETLELFVSAEMPFSWLSFASFSLAFVSSSAFKAVMSSSPCSSAGICKIRSASSWGSRCRSRRFTSSAAQSSACFARNE